MHIILVSNRLATAKSIQLTLRHIVMLSAPKADAHVNSPLLVGSTGVLERPLETFTFG